jgi:hypothetical protein
VRPGGITLVITLPAELHAGASAALARAAVHPPPDGTETELAGPVVAELDEAGRHQVDGGQRGWAVLADDGSLQGLLYFHLGDDSGFRAVRVGQESDIAPSARQLDEPTSTRAWNGWPGPDGTASSFRLGRNHDDRSSVAITGCPG